MHIYLRKVGGIWWLAVGPYRVSFCRTNRRPKIPADWLPVDLSLPVERLVSGDLLRTLYARRAVA